MVRARRAAVPALLGVLVVAASAAVRVRGVRIVGVDVGARARGRGEIFSWTVTHQALDPSWTVPFAIVVAEMDEGPRLVGNLRGGLEPANLRLGLPVAVLLEPVSDTVALTHFGPLPIQGT